MWRNAIDLTDSWDRVYKVIRIYGDNIGNFSAVTGPGHWNDADQVRYTIQPNVLKCISHAKKSPLDVHMNLFNFKSLNFPHIKFILKFLC